MTSVDPFLVIVAIIVALVLVAAIGMTIIYFQHPDDRNVAIFPKCVVLFGLWISCANVLILPFDVTNTQVAGGLNMNVLWQISIYCTAFTLVILLPFAYFYYENDIDDNAPTAGCCGLIPNWNSQFCEGVKWSLGFLFCFMLVLIIMYFTMNEADIPVKYRAFKFLNDNGQPSSQRVAIGDDIPDNIDCSGTSCDSDEITITISVSFAVYMVALLAFLGWFLFIVFAGTGLVALPYDLFNDWRYRPQPIPLKTYVTEKEKMGERAAILRQAGRAIKEDQLNALGRKLSRKEKQEMADTFHRFENAVYLLKKDYYHLQTSYKLRGGNPFIAWIKLFMSVIGGSISLLWVLHICIYMLPDEPLDPFLNNLFVDLSLDGFNLFGVVAFAFYAFWLQLAVIKGNFRFGLRIPCCRVFPMDVGETMMNSFLANVFLILLTSMVVVQFSAYAFPVYARNTEVDLLFGQQIRYLRFFNYFFDNNVFIYAMLGFVLLGAITLAVCPRKPSEQIEKELNELTKDKKVQRKDLEMAAGGKGKAQYRD